MRHRFISSTGALVGVLAIGSLTPATVAGQTPSTPTKPAKAVTPKAWAPPRTPWGEPDLQGIWTNTREFGTPFEKPAEYEGKTEEELPQLLRARYEQEQTPEARKKRLEFADDPGNSGTG